MDKRRNLSPEVKAARAAARTETRMVRAYLEGLQSSEGRRRTRKSPEQQIQETQEKLQSESDVIKKLTLNQTLIDAQRRLSQDQGSVDLEALEEEFVKVAKSYADRKKVSYKAWRAMGVPAAALTKSGIARTRS